MGSTDLPRSVDTVVVGAGAGGAAFASALAAHSDENVLLLEAGPDYGPLTAGQWPSDMLDARYIPLSHDYTLRHASGSRSAALDLPRARIAGGCTAHNGCTASVGAREDYDEWSRIGGPGWSAAEVEPLLQFVHDRFRVRRYGMDELTPPQRAFVEAGLASGLPFADDLDTLEAAEGIGPMPVNIVDGVRWNSAFAFLDAVRHLPNLCIAGGVTVQRVDLHAGRATGVTVRRGTSDQRISAARVVVAAGAYHSPALLLASGIGPADDLRALGIASCADLPGVGGHLLDHACVQLDFTGTPGLQEEIRAMAWGPDEQTVGRARSSVCDSGPYDMHVFMVAGSNSGHPDLPPITLYGGAMRAKSEGRVTLGPNLDVVSPVIDHRYGTDPEGYDRQVFREALELLTDMSSRKQLAAILGSAVGRDHDPLDRIASYCHPAGSCKMGPASDSTAVVDWNGGVHGVEGLFVSDASVMPSITRGNINLPTAMIGIRIAAGLLNRAPADLASSSAWTATTK